MTIIITGANRGLGFEAARVLANDISETIVLAGRNLPALEVAAKRIREKTGNMHVLAARVDLADLSSVRHFSAEIRERKLPPLNCIICNAGISRPDVEGRSVDGYEIMFAVNHLGHFLLVNLLLDLLSPPARIIFVSSGVEDPGRARGPMQAPRFIKAEWLAFPERDTTLTTDESLSGGQAYATSKLCNVLCTYELARRLEANQLSTPENPIAVNAFAPGLVAGTGLGRYESVTMKITWYLILPIISRMMGFGRSPAQAGADLAYLVSSPDLGTTTGVFFSGREIVPSSDESHDLKKAEDLWQTSIKLCRLQPGESPFF